MHRTAEMLSPKKHWPTNTIRNYCKRAGLVVERNGQLQDNYRDRIIFPIHNNSGKSLALVRG